MCHFEVSIGGIDDLLLEEGAQAEGLLALVHFMPDFSDKHLL
jgi:hypothetical protein